MTLASKIIEKFASHDERTKHKEINIAATQ